MTEYIKKNKEENISRQDTFIIQRICVYEKEGIWDHLMKENT